jgi:hypothetical protein
VSTVREAFAPPTDEATITGLGVLFLVYSVLSFTRRLQRLYEESWSLPPRALRGTRSGLAWIACFAIYMPSAIDSSAASYGAIGVAFALLTWLWGVGFVLVCSAVYRSPQMQWRRSAR